jgi:hypothetical protein
MHAITDDFTIVLARVIAKAQRDAALYIKYRNALKIANRLGSSETKARHRSHIMVRMNQLRGAYVSCN